MDPSLYKQTKTQRGFTYAYYFSPPSAGKPVLFLAHGFPCNSHLWRAQVAFFQPRGFGLVVPDMLGYGGTDKPTDPAHYTGGGLAQDAVDILDAEGIARVIAMGHDRGSYLVSSLVTRHPARVAACAYVTVGYSPPTGGYKDAILQPGLMTQRTGYENFAYMRFFVQPDAAALIERNIDSFLCVIYPKDPQIWRDNMCVEGGARAWVESDKRTPHASYMTPELLEHERTALLKSGLTGPLCWYKGILEAQVADDATHTLRQPLLFVACTRDLICVPTLWDANHSKYAKGGFTRRELEADHWVHESHPAELNRVLDEWLHGLDV
ncbi:alpha/beta-hydrolase [Mycena latifolia]|nr:alpha/beta-hydrolase [Mycena latifolia]